MKILSSKSKNFNNVLDKILLSRKNKLQSKSQSVVKIINDVKKNGDKAVLKYEKNLTKIRTLYLIQKKF